MPVSVVPAGEVGGGEWPLAWRAGSGKAAEQEPAVASATTTDTEQHEALDSVALRGHHLELVLARAVPTVREIDHLWECLGELARSLASLGRVWRLSPFGSVRNMLLTRGSDIDVTIYRSDAQDEGDSAAAVRVLQGSVLSLLSQSPRFEVVRLVSGARIPVLSLRFDGAVDVDLSCHNTEPLRNSQLLRAYAQASPMARALALLVKLWSKAAGVCGAQCGHLTSYALALMALYFLQVHSDFGLFVLSTQLFDGFGSPPDAPRWECRPSLPEALRQFFAFYSQEFAWGSEVVSVRLGRRCAASDPEFARLPNARSRALAIACMWRTLSSRAGTSTACSASSRRPSCWRRCTPLRPRCEAAACLSAWAARRAARPLGWLPRGADGAASWAGPSRPKEAYDDHQGARAGPVPCGQASAPVGRGQAGLAS
ncbi:unnamed protein product [Prorocentrum cordatum]|uniref:Poly(A) RNA polymerase mitochondrial-like central palm domain-containing protein n=1 Tax=Prorocentrum cordatum TaxID=2364126 RepID=A0ABN9RHP6_9DINO|nr:unnamed protein product [Polarella glacialis]